MPSDKLSSSDIKRRVSSKKKRAADFRRQKEMMDVYDIYHGWYRDDGQIDKFDVNYGLFNGDLDIDLYEDPICINVNNEQIELEKGTIVHYPLISQVANELHGEMINRPFQPIAEDIGSFSKSLRLKEWNKLLQQYLQQEVLDPIQQQSQMLWQAQEGVDDILSLPPELQQQAQQAIQQEVEKRTPEEIIDFMMNDYQTPTQRQAQQLLDYFVDYQNIKEKADEGFKHAIITGWEFYYIGDMHDEPYLELLNPKYVSWGASQNVEWLQDADWVKYEEWMSYESVLQKYGEHLRNKDITRIEELFEPIGGFPRGAEQNPYKPDIVKERAMYELSLEDGWALKQYPDINYKTKGGQRQLVSLYRDIIDKYGHDYGKAYGAYGIRVARFAWRDKAKMYKVKTMRDGEKKVLWFREHYEERPEDIEVIELWVDEVWEGTKIGTGDHAIYVNIRPTPAQFKSIFSPYGVALPFVGKGYNTHMNNADNVSIIDLGKPWQMEFDTTMAEIKHDMATDLGTIFMFSLTLKPENTPWQDWVNTIANSGLMPIDYKKHGIDGIDPQMIRSIPMSKISDIAGKLQFLEMFRNNLILAMNSNPSRMGTIGQYATNQNIEYNTVASYNQTENYFETHRQIVEKALNMFMNRAKFIYKDREYKTSHILDDVSAADLKLGPDFWYSEFAIKITTDSEDIKKIEMLRNRMLEFIQNGLSFEGVLSLTLAKTPSDIMDVMTKETKRLEQQRQEAMAMEQQKQEKEIAAEQAEKQAEREFEMLKHREQLQSQERRAVIDSQKFMLQNDVDRNQVSDLLQKAVAEIQADLQKHREELQFKEKEHEDKMEIEREKLNKE